MSSDVHKASVNGSSGVCLEGMSSAELTMVRRLAGNDPIVRKKTLRKLKKWLNILSQKVPDTPDCRSVIEPNFIRVWKALFYCMWMADKPLPQEQLAEQLSDLQNIFSSKSNPYLVFVEWFFKTIAREWNWIDRFRIDKFMMLFRRFLRKSLLVMAQKKWHNDYLEGFLKIISANIFNRAQITKSKRRQSFSSPLDAVTPLGLQIHFVDVFMEELAKIGGSNLKFQKLLKILSVFVQELGYNNDDRLLDEIRERIFHHLMRQSDVGIDYQEQLEFGCVEADEEDIDDDGNEIVEDEVENDEVFEALNEDDGPLDPRAGAVDVILPQLDVDYSKLYEKLIEYGGQKDVKLKNRRILYSLASQFKELSEGKYPLALPEDNMHGPAIPRKEIDKAAKRLIQAETVPGDGKRRKTKRERKRDAIRKLNGSLPSVGSEDDSRYINDSDLLDHVTDNYMSYLEDEVEAKANSESADVTDGSEETAKPIKKKKTKENKKKKSAVETEEKVKAPKRKWKTIVEVEADELPPVSLKSSPLNVEETQQENKEEVVLVKRPKMAKRNSMGSLKTADAITPIMKGKSRRLTELITPKGKASPLNKSLSSSARKRVSFILARNKEHDHEDYPVSIARSPAIPFDKDKKPDFGLLKSPASSTPKSTPFKRATALDFF